MGLFPKVTVCKQTWGLGGWVPVLGCCFMGSGGHCACVSSSQGWGCGRRSQQGAELPPSGQGWGLPTLDSLVSLGRKQDRAKQAFLALRTYTYQQSHQLDWHLFGQSWNTASQTSVPLRNMRGHLISIIPLPHPPFPGRLRVVKERRLWGPADLTSLLTPVLCVPGQVTSPLGAWAFH